MSLRQSLSSALRRCQSALPQQRQQQQQQHIRALSTTAPVADLKTLPTSKRSLDANDSLQTLINERMDRGGPLSSQEQEAFMDRQASRASTRDLREVATTESFLKQMPRRWRTGDVYGPRDLSPREMQQWRVPKRPKKDIMDLLGINPLDNYKNFSLISEFVTAMGRIKPSHETGLRPVNQRKMAKAVRRAIGMGLHPSVHRHPEILRYSKQALPLTAIPSANSAQDKL